MIVSRFGIYFGTFGLNYGTPANNKPLNGNAVSTQALVDTAIGNMLDDLKNSPVTDVMVWLLHFPDSGSPFVDQPHLLVLNGVPIVPTRTSGGDLWELSPQLPEIIQELRSSGKNVVASMGGWDGSGSFGTIAEIGVDNFVEQLENQLFGPYNINGLDVDLEGGDTLPWSEAYREHSQTVVELSNQLASKGYAVSHAPASGFSSPFYTGPCPGLPGSQSILQATYDATAKSNSIRWLNMQFYAGGDPGSASAAVSGFESLVDTLNQQTESTGIPQPQSFIAAGFSPCIQDPSYPGGLQPLTDSCPACGSSTTVVTEALQGIGSAYPDTNGGSFDWLYGYYVSSQGGYQSQKSNWNSMAAAI